MAQSVMGGTPDYDPFSAGRFTVIEHAFHALDRERHRTFPCQVWRPAGRGDTDNRAARPLVVYSHHSGGQARSASYLCTHLASHGYVVAALNHSEVVAPQLAGREEEVAEERAARIKAIIASRVPDVRFLLDYLLGQNASGEMHIDGERVGLAGHSFGGWTVLAVPESDQRVRAVVALGPGGSSDPEPGILPLTLTFAWGRDVPVLYLAAEDDVPIPLAGVQELFDRTPEPKRMFILRRADHQHFIDNVEAEHEAARAMSFPGDAAWIPAAMRPIGELCSGEQAHLFMRGLTLAHLDATLRQSPAASTFLSGDVLSVLASHGVAGLTYRP
jgi:dienelactone hydrolase